MSLSIARLVFYTLSLLGTVQLWGRSVLDGTLGNLLTALHGPDVYQFPRTHAHLQASFTGIFPIDYLLRILVVFFWEVADGSHPTSSAIGLYFLGQLFSMLAVFYFESSRAGVGSSVLMTTFWVAMFQMTGIGCAGPFWAVWHLASSADFAASPSLAALKRSSLVPANVAISILAALFIGYAGPAILMTFPTPEMLSYNLKQATLVVWNVFPLWVLVLLLTLRAYAPKSPPAARKSASLDGQHRQHITAMSVAYGISFVVSTYSHVAILAVTVSTRLFPALFNPGLMHTLHPRRVFVPPMAIEVVRTVGDGTRSFMLWDQVFGYGTVLLVLLLRVRQLAPVARVDLGWAKLLAGSFLCCLIFGPGSACLLLSWLGDLMLYKN